MSALILLVLFGCAYFVYCVVVAPSEYAVYGYLLGWMFFPKFIQKLPILGYLPWEGVRIFDVIQALIAFPLLYLCLSRPSRNRFRTRLGLIRWLLLGFTLMTLITFSSVLFLGRSRLVELSEISTLDVVRPTMEMLYSALFGWGCLKFIDTMDRTERLLWILALGGIELVAEVVFLYYLHLVPALDPWIFDTNNTGRFNSLAYLSFDTVGLVSIVYICAILYFIFERRRYLWLVPFPVLFLPTIATLEKAPFAAAIIACGVFFGLTARRQRAIALFCVLACLFFVVAMDSTRLANLPDAVNAAFGGTSRNDNNIEQTFYARLGLWVRGGDLLIAAFPLGVGNGLVENAMASDVPMRFGSLVHGEVSNVYNEVAGHAHVTNVHNMFLEFLVENGLPGMVVLAAYGAMCISAFVRFAGMAFAPTEEDRKVLYMGGCVFSALAGMSWRFLFESGDKLYFMLFMLIFLAYLVPDIRGRRAPSAQAER